MGYSPYCHNRVRHNFATKITNTFCVPPILSSPHSQALEVIDLFTISIVRTCVHGRYCSAIFFSYNVFA